MKPLLTLLLLTATLFANIPLNTHDAQDHRIAKIVEGTTTTYLVDPNIPYARVIHESRDNGTEIDYSYGLRLLGDGSHSFLTDALGSTRALVDSAGQLTDSYDYSPYGELRKHSGTSDNTFLFTGEQYDPEAELYYLRARYYDPAISRFLSRDTYEGTLTDPLSQNPYLYARGNPTVYVDPSGRCFTMSGMMQATVITGILATSYYATIGNNSRGGYGGSAWLTVAMYNLAVLQQDLLIRVWLAGVLPEDRTDEQKKEADYNHGEYKNFCENKPNRYDYPDECSYLIASIVHARKCIEKIEEFDRKWTDNRHKDNSLKTWKQRLKKLQDNVEKACK